MKGCLKEVTFKNRYEHWIIRLYAGVPGGFIDQDLHPVSRSAGFPEYIAEYIRCPGCGTILREYRCSRIEPVRDGDAFVFLFQCSCMKYVVVKNYFDYGERVEWPDNSGRIRS